MSLDQAIELAFKVIKENMEQKINKDNIEITYIRTSENRIVALSTDQIEGLITKI